MNKRFILNILKMCLSNFLQLFSGILVGFIVPKIMGYDDYANFKIYTLYLTYLSLFTIGFGDGLYLKFAGIDKERLNKSEISYLLRKYYLQLFLFFIIILFLVLFFLPKEYFFIGICLCVSLISTNVVSVHQNLSLITSSFNEYSLRTVIKALFTSIFVIFLYVLFKINASEISYKIYLFGYISIEILLAIWYVVTYREFNFGKVKKEELTGLNYKSILYIGFPLLLSNMAGTIFLNLDRQFVSILFDKTDYAIYAFAYNMLSLITTMTTAISLVIFPSMKKIQNIDVKVHLEKYLTVFSVLVCFCLMVYFPLYYFIHFFLEKYINSLEIFAIVLPGIVLSSTISVIFFNFYKLDNKVKLYLCITLSAIVISIGLNFGAYFIFKNYCAISWASIISISIWYVMVSIYFVRKYKLNIIKNSVFIVLSIVLFYTCVNYIDVVWLSGIIYMAALCMISFLLYYKIIISKIKKNANKGE